jgi:hypothetical protein
VKIPWNGQESILGSSSRCLHAWCDAKNIQRRSHVAS